MATVKSINTILAELKTFIRAYCRYLDTGDTSLAKDLVLTPFSVGGRLLMDQVGAVSDLHVLSRLTGSDLDNEGSNYGLERSKGTLATVNLTFYATNVPTIDMFVEAGTQVGTVGTSFGSPVIFQTVADTSFPLASIGSYYSYDRARYEFTVPAVCTITGETGNVGSGSISVINGSVSQINGVTNLIASSGGSGIESDEDFRIRIALKIAGRNLNTVNGLRAFARASAFIDAYAIRVEDADSERSTGVDLFVVDPFFSAATDTFTYTTSTERYYLANTPVDAVTSVVSAVVGAIGADDYDVHIDNASPLRRSVHASDYLTIRASASIPTGTAFTVTYTYSENIANFQNSLEQDANNVLTSSVLVKRAFELFLYMNVSLTLITNADGPTTRQRVKNAMIQYMDTYRMGTNLQKSDLIIVLQQGYGDFPVTTVDAVVINSWYLQDEFGTTYNPVDDTITVDKTKYARYGSATVV
jgi:hypothetical protein